MVAQSPFPMFPPIPRVASLATAKLPTVVLAAVLAFGLAATAKAESQDVVAVFSTTYNGYHRTRLPDHTYQPETFTFARGGYNIGPISDDSIEGVPFMKIVRTLAAPLRQQKYVVGVDPKKTDLIIFVYWGTTTGSMGRADYSNALSTFQTTTQAMRAGPQGTFPAFSTEAAVQRSLDGDNEMSAAILSASNYWRDEQNRVNARLLGYGAALNFATAVPWLSVSHSYVEDLEMNRYFVLLQAFDFQLLWKHKEWKPLWQTVYSMPQQGNRFDKDLARMTAEAARYFGKAKGLVREQPPEGRVEVGTPTVVTTPSK